MKRASIILLLLVISVIQVACTNQNQRLGQKQALQIAWKTLDQNTPSLDVESWEINEARKVVGGEVVSEFSIPSKENCPGPRFPENQPIKVSSEYWYIKVLPQSQDLPPQKDTAAPSSMPIVPEPSVQSAIYLIDMYNGDVIARKITCQDIP
jgi:hypothetical protein